METVLALHDANDRTTRTLYSLEKLIEWKHISAEFDIHIWIGISLLAREIN